jgi:hypothetical protein
VTLGSDVGVRSSVSSTGEVALVAVSKASNFVKEAPTERVQARAGVLPAETRKPQRIRQGLVTRVSVSTRSAPGGIRTPNLLIRNQMLYPLSYGRSAATGIPGTQRRERLPVDPAQTEIPVRNVAKTTG